MFNFLHLILLHYKYSCFTALNKHFKANVFQTAHFMLQQQVSLNYKLNSAHNIKDQFLSMLLKIITFSNLLPWNKCLIVSQVLFLPTQRIANPITTQYSITNAQATEILYVVQILPCGPSILIHQSSKHLDGIITIDIILLKTREDRHFYMT